MSTTTDLEYGADGIPVLRLDTTADHHAVHARLRAAGPVARVVLPGEVTAWTVTTHALAEQLVTDDRISKNWKYWNAIREGTIPDGWPLAPLFAPKGNMLSAEGPDHGRLKRPVTAALTRRRVDALQPRIADAASRFAAQLPEHAEAGVVDLRPHYAYPIPMGTICTLLGIPDTEQPRVQALADALFSITMTPEQAEQLESDRIALLSEVVGRRRERPGDDLTSELIKVCDTGSARPGGISRVELVDTLWVTVTAGYETTAALIQNAICALLAHPAQLALALAAHDAGDLTVWDRVVEESLRYNSSVRDFPGRYTTEPVNFGGVTIPAGEAVLAPYAGVGRDPDQHGPKKADKRAPHADRHGPDPAQCGPDADQFDITRTQRKHLAFGGGRHVCPGALLARIQTALALKALFTRYPDLQLAGTHLALVASLISNTVTTLPVRLPSDTQPVDGDHRADVLDHARTGDSSLGHDGAAGSTPPAPGVPGA